MWAAKQSDLDWIDAEYSPKDIWGNPMEENRRLAKDFRALEEDSCVRESVSVRVSSGMQALLACKRG